MKIAIIGTQNSSTVVDERDILRRIAVEGLQRRAGYVAATMPTDNFVSLPPLHEKFIVCAEVIIQTLFDDKNISTFNPRVPYLLIAWMCLAFDIPTASLTPITRQIPSVFLRITLGDDISSDYLNRLDENAWNAWADAGKQVKTTESVAIFFTAERNRWAARIAKALMVASDVSVAYDILYAKEARGIMIGDFIPLAMEWLYLDNASCLRIARELLYKMFVL
jgi:hypothetical protein